MKKKKIFLYGGLLCTLTGLLIGREANEFFASGINNEVISADGSIQTTPTEALPKWQSVEAIGNDISVSGISVSPTSKILEKGTEEQLAVSITPSNAANKNVIWSSSNPETVTVSDTGRVNALQAGTSFINVRTEDGNKTATSTIIVDDHGDSAATATPVSFNSTTAGTIAYANDLDYYQITVPVKAVCQFSSTSGTYLDVKGYLYDAKMRQLAVNDDGNGNRQFKIERELSPGTYYLMVRHYSLGTGGYQVKVESEAIPVVTVNDVAIVPETAEVFTGSEVQLTAAVSPNNATNKTVSWSSSNNDVASVSGNGLVKGRKAGQAVITVTTADGNKTATSVVTVKEETPNVVEVTSVSVTPASKEVNIGESAQLTAAVSPSNATNKTVSWSSSNNDVASVSGNGLVKGRKAGQAVITVTTADGNRTATSVVTVKEETPNVVEVTSVSVTPASKEVNIGESAQLTAAVSPSNATNKIVSWSSSNNDVASVSGNGLVKGRKAGQAVITVTTADGNKTATSVVTVKGVQGVPVNGVTVTPVSDILEKGTHHQLTAVITPANATNKEIIWSSSDARVASVSSTGDVTTHQAGTVEIMATTADGGKTAVSTITVDDHGSSSVTATPVELNSTTAGVMAYANDLDYFKIVISVADSYRFTSESRSYLDVKGYLYDARMRQLATNDDSNGNRQFKIERELQPGIYYLMVRHYSNGIGQYSVNISEVND